VFDNLAGKGKPLPKQENPFVEMSEDALANKVLKNAGAAPQWIEQNKEIRQALLKARANLALSWAACLPTWPPRPEEMSNEPTAPHIGSSIAAGGGPQEVVPLAASGHWRMYNAPGALKLPEAAPPSTSPRSPSPAGSHSAIATSPSLATSASTTSPTSSASSAGLSAPLLLPEAMEAQQASTAALRGRRPAGWPLALETFREDIEAINKQIATYNLSVPAMWQQQPRRQHTDELRRALREAPSRSVELLADAKSRQAAGLGGTRTSLHTRAAAYSVSMGSGEGPSFALHSGPALARPTFPGLIESLRSAFFT